MRNNILIFVWMCLSLTAAVGLVRPVATNLPVHNVNSGEIIAQSNSTTTVYLNPPTINGTAIGVNNTITVNINISDAFQITDWWIGLTFNSTLLECTGFSEGEFLKNVGPTLWTPGTIDNTKGVVNAYGCCFLSPGLEHTANGSGRLAYATFEVKAPGVSDIHLHDVKVMTRVFGFFGWFTIMVQFEIIDVYTVVVDTTPHTVVTVSGHWVSEQIPWSIVDVYTATLSAAKTVVTVCNSTGVDSVEYGVEYGFSFYGHVFTLGYGISFNVTGPYQGWSNVTIPETLMSGTPEAWIIILDGTPLDIGDRIVTYNGTHYSINFTYSEGIHTIQITSPYVLPEFPIWSTMMFVLIVLTVSIVIYKRRLLKTPIH